MADADALSFLSGIFYSAQEKQPSDISTRIPSCNDDSKLVVGSKVYTSGTM